jgi:hypothetical protein
MASGSHKRRCVVSEDRTTTRAKEAPETYAKGTFAPAGAVTVCPRYGAIITRRSKDHPFKVVRPKLRAQHGALESFSRGPLVVGTGWTPAPGRSPAK